MSIHIRCPGCDKSLKAPDQMAGKAVRCPNCKRPLKIPVPKSADDLALEALRDRRSRAVIVVFRG